VTRSQRQRTDGMIGNYPDDWDTIAYKIKDKRGWRCERCGHPHAPSQGYTLTTHHLDMDKSNCEPWNLAVLCQRCHLTIQGRVDFLQGWMLEHSDWMRYHVEAFNEAKGITR